MMMALITALMLQATPAPAPLQVLVVAEMGAGPEAVAETRAVLTALNAGGRLPVRLYRDARIESGLDDCWRTVAGLTTTCALRVLNGRAVRGRPLIVFVRADDERLYWTCLARGQQAAFRAPSASLVRAARLSDTELQAAAACLTSARDGVD